MGHMEARRCRYSDWRHCVVVRRLTPLLRRIGCILFYTIVGAETRRASRAGGDGAESVMHHCLVVWMSVLPLAAVRCVMFLWLVVVCTQWPGGDAKMAYSQSDRTMSSRIWHRGQYLNWLTGGQHRGVGEVWYLRLPCLTTTTTTSTSSSNSVKRHTTARPPSPSIASAITATSFYVHQTVV